MDTNPHRLPAIPGCRWETSFACRTARCVSAATGATLSTWDHEPDGWVERFEMRGPLYDHAAIDAERVMETTKFDPPRPLSAWEQVLAKLAE